MEIGVWVGILLSAVREFFSREFLRTATPLVSLNINDCSRIFYPYDYTNFES